MIPWFYVFCCHRCLSPVPEVPLVLWLTRRSARSRRAHYGMGDPAQARRAAAAMDSGLFAGVACRSAMICHWSTGHATSSLSQYSGDVKVNQKHLWIEGNSHFSAAGILLCSKSESSRENHDRQSQEQDNNWDDKLCTVTLWNGFWVALRGNRQALCYSQLPLPPVHRWQADEKWNSCTYQCSKRFISSPWMPPRCGKSWCRSTK